MENPQTKKDLDLMRIILEVQAQIGGLESIVQDLVRKSEGDDFNLKAYHQRLIACRQAYALQASFQIEDIDPSIASKIFGVPTEINPPEDAPPLA